MIDLWTTPEIERLNVSLTVKLNQAQTKFGAYIGIKQLIVSKYDKNVI